MERSTRAHLHRSYAVESARAWCLVFKDDHGAFTEVWINHNGEPERVMSVSGDITVATVSLIAEAYRQGRTRTVNNLVPLADFARVKAGA